MGRNESFEADLEVEVNAAPSVITSVNIGTSVPVAHESEIQHVNLCDCAGSYCKYFWCPLPYVWYKITKAMNMGTFVKTLLAFSILYTIFMVGAIVYAIVNANVDADFDENNNCLWVVIVGLLITFIAMLVLLTKA